MTPSSLNQLDEAVRIIRRGGVIAYPTETVYGLGCDPAMQNALLRILAIKRRPATSGFILIAARWEQLDGWIEPSLAERQRLDTPLTQPVSWIVTAGPLATPLLTGQRPTLAVRLSSHPVARRLCELGATPLVSTSANRHGKAPLLVSSELRQELGEEIDLVVDARAGGGRPSEIREAATGKVLRPG